MRYGIFRWLLALASVAWAGAACAQEDSARVERDTLRATLPQGLVPEVSSGFSPVQGGWQAVKPVFPSRQALPKFRPNPADTPPYYVNPSPLFRGDYSTGGVIGRWRGNTFTGAGIQTSLPGLGLMREASVGYVRQLNDRLALQASVNAVKLSMANFNAQSFGASAALVWQAQDHLWFTAYGGVNAGDALNRKYWQYGGTVGFDVTDRFSLELGVDRSYNPMTGRWETRPVLIPSYQFTEKFKLGLDVGGLLYEILRSTVFDKPERGGGPMVRPEVPGYMGGAWRR